MGAMRLPLRPTVVKSSSFSLAPGALTLPADFAAGLLGAITGLTDSTIPTSHRLTIEDSASPIWRGEVELGGSFRSNFACFFDGTSF
ncbi:hypothetical protein TNCV_483691 [Trichonephila clavipes]|nr:hypothetical protein TNCV_483691 [Trichonephila clavipes]